MIEKGNKSSGWNYQGSLSLSLFLPTIKCCDDDLGGEGRGKENNGLAMVVNGLSFALSLSKCSLCMLFSLR